MAGQITAATIDSGASATAPLFKANGTEIGTLCRAWVNFNAASNTIRGSFNVSSVVINSTGDITTFYTNNMPDVNYSWFISQQLNGTGNNDTGATSSGRNFGTGAWGVNYIRTNTMANTNLTQENPLVLTIAIFR